MVIYCNSGQSSPYEIPKISTNLIPIQPESEWTPIANKIFPTSEKYLLHFYKNILINFNLIDFLRNIAINSIINNDRQYQ